MAQLLQLVDATRALVALLASQMDAAYEHPVDVKQASKNDFDDEGELVLKKVAVRVQFGQAEYAQTRDISATTLSASLMYQIVCRHESLRSDSERRDRTMELVQAVQAVLAGARLLLVNGTKSGPIILHNVLPVSDGFGVIDDCYGLTIEVPGFAQFTGANANPGGQA
jgi:hypothetical protein